MTVRRMSRLSLILVLVWAASAAMAQDPTPLFFDTDDTGAPDANAPLIEPWKTIPFDEEYSGYWVVAGDLDGDGRPEFVSARNVDENDVHYTSAAVAQRLDGTVLWRWGDPTVGRRGRHHDVACQIHDWDGDGKPEVVVAGDQALIELNGQTGQEKRRWAIPEGASDCLVFCDLSGRGRPTDVLVKTRYTDIWAYSQDGTLLWTVSRPGRTRTAHQPRPVDIDGDGRDEIMAGYALLNADGSVRWTYRSKAVRPRSGHLDCMRVAHMGTTPGETRLVLTCCGADNFACIDGNGKVIWEVPGYHFESIDVGHVIPEHPGPQFLVDVDHRPLGDAPLWLIDRDGVLLGRINTDYCRRHVLIDWTGDGYDEIVVATRTALYDHKGLRIGTFHIPELLPEGESIRPTNLFQGDMTGDGVPDLVISSNDAIYIFKNKNGKKPNPPAPLGSGLNYTLY